MDIQEFELVKRSAFPTNMFQVDLPDSAALNTMLLANIYAEQERDLKGLKRSNFAELGGWHSQNYLHKSEAYSDLVSLIGNATARMSDELGYSSQHRLTIGTMWSIINPPGSSNRAHIHPGCLWSGVYYIQAPEGAGDIEFFDPRTAHLMRAPKYLEEGKKQEEARTKVKITPKPGRLLIFPSWLYHAVDPNMSKGTGRAGQRIIISFNLNQVKKSSG